MPVINTSYKDMVRIIGHDVPMDTVLEQVPLMGGVIDEHEEGSDAIAIEFFPNRPDMYSAEGIARGLKAFLGFEPGLKKYELGKSDVKAIAPIRMQAKAAVRHFLKVFIVFSFCYVR